MKLHGRLLENLSLNHKLNTINKFVHICTYDFYFKFYRQISALDVKQLCLTSVMKKPTDQLEQTKTSGQFKDDLALGQCWVNIKRRLLTDTKWEGHDSSQLHKHCWDYVHFLAKLPCRSMLWINKLIEPKTEGQFINDLALGYCGSQINKYY